MPNDQNNKPVYDLEERTFQFAKAIRIFVKSLKNTMANIEDSKQLIRSSGSIGANYREANEALGRKDFLMRVKICRKEAKESHYWLRLICETNSMNHEKDIKYLITEAEELKKIFSAIIEKSR
jgi:four helix bundle protein